MKYTGIGMVLIYLMLAVLSRKYFSKYQDRNICIRVFLTMAAFLISNLEIDNFKLKVQQYIKKTHTSSAKEIRRFTDEYIEKLVAMVLAMIFLLVTILTAFLLAPAKEKGEENILFRDSYGGSENIHEIKISDGINEEKYSLTVLPREYTKAEFESLARNTLEYLKKVMPGENESLDRVTSDLILPSKDETGTLTIEWHSNYAIILNSHGSVNVSEITEPVEVMLTATIYDNNFQEEYDFKVCCIKEQVQDSSISEAFSNLEKIERNTRKNQSVVIPGKIGNTEVKLEYESKNEKVCKVFCFGIVLILLVVCCLINKLKEKAKKRDLELTDDYFRFVNKIVLMLRAGMNVKSAFINVINRKNQDDVIGNNLVAEIRKLINELDSGESEMAAYAEMGNSIGLPEYIKLMSLIGQNLNRGNSNLLLLLENEEKEAVLLKKEMVRKKGEEASSKLLIPMFVLMIVIIAIVVFPAITGF